MTNWRMFGKIFVVTMAILLNVTISHAQVNLGADIVSRYVWRGADFGNSPSIQPTISYTLGNVEIGAWSAWSITGAPNGNENDLYLTASFGSFGLTLTDYFYPAYGGKDNFFNYEDSAGVHILEISGSYGVGPLSVMGAMNILGDGDDSKYLELGYELLTGEELGASLIAGFGDGVYTTDGGFGAVHMGVCATKGIYSASYIINPDGETSFLVFGVSF